MKRNDENLDFFRKHLSLFSTSLSDQLSQSMSEECGSKCILLRCRVLLLSSYLPSNLVNLSPSIRLICRCTTFTTCTSPYHSISLLSSRMKGKQEERRTTVSAFNNDILFQLRFWYPTNASRSTIIHILHVEPEFPSADSLNQDWREVEKRTLD